MSALTTIGARIGTPVQSFPPIEIVTITGTGTADWDIKDHLGNSLRSAFGYNLGEYPYYQDGDADKLIKSLYDRGQRVIRLAAFDRNGSNPQKGIGDGRVDSCPDWICPRNRARLIAHIEACAKYGMKWILVIEGDVMQGGTGQKAIYDHSLQLAALYGESVPAGHADWGDAGGYNVFTSKILFNQLRHQVKQVVRLVCGYPHCLAVELQSEPLPVSGFRDDLAPPYIYPGSNGDGVYDITWTTGSTAVHQTLESLYRTLIADVWAIAPWMNCLLGGSRAYDLDPQLADIITALSNPAGVGGNLLLTNKLIFTIDILSSGVTAANVAFKMKTLLALKVPCLINQFGTRRITEDPADNFFNLGASALKAGGVPIIVWEHISNTQNGYGERYYNGDGDSNKEHAPAYPVVDGGARIVTIDTQCTQTFAAMETDAIAAAIAEHVLMFHVLPFDGTKYPNLWQDAAGTTPVTAIGQPVGRWAATADPDGLGYVYAVPAGNLIQRPTLGWAMDDGAGNSYLPHKRPVLIGDGTNTLMRLMASNGTTEVAFWPAGGGNIAGTEPVFIMVAGTPATRAFVQTFFCQGSTERWPRLYSAASKMPTFQCQGTDAVNHSVDGTGFPGGPTLTSANIPMVLCGTKSGGAGSEVMTLYVHGRQEGQITGQTVGGVTSPSTRTRIFGTSNGPDYIGSIGQVCMGRVQVPSNTNRYKMGRLGGQIQGGGYMYTP